ncbi:helix-turn-helix transcriptional regulator [Halonatronum saccharophilum]|uniref:helix-turn-helix transcriptional regulator n=1 Tax=Halonatronum saccharophilum TaxID=150060 RepID=UPI0004B7B974|nr:LuxR C-terminal-related transcriptional regulator [Halonatronum saccharophilum]
MDFLVGEKMESSFNDKIIKVGTSFAEDSCGTNAISMAMWLKRDVYLKPKEHYCDFLKGWHCYALPILVDNKIIGYLDLSTIDVKLKKELIAIAILLRDKIVNSFIRRKSSLFDKKGQIELNDVQIKILELMAKGLKRGEIADKLCCSKSNTKYHKSRIFDKLGVNSKVEAVLEGVRRGLISLEEI